MFPKSSSNFREEVLNKKNLLLAAGIIVAPVCIPHLGLHNVIDVAFGVDDARVCAHGSSQVVASGTGDLTTHEREAAGVVGTFPPLRCY